MIKAGNEKRVFWRGRLIFLRLNNPYFRRKINANDIRNNKNQELNEIKFNLETYKNKLDSLTKNLNEN